MCAGRRDIERLEAHIVAQLTDTPVYPNVLMVEKLNGGCYTLIDEEDIFVRNLHFNIYGLDTSMIMNYEVKAKIVILFQWNNL